MREPEFLLFASDATWATLAGGVLLAISALALIGERRRLRRRHIDAVGWMPWNALSVLTCFAGLVLLAMGVTGWIRG